MNTDGERGAANIAKFGRNEGRQRSRTRRIVVFLLANAAFTLMLASAAFVYGWSRFADSLPDLQGWHTEAPTSEFVAADAVLGYTFDDYLVQEEAVFAELRRLVEGQWSKTVSGDYSRFKVGSASNPEQLLERNWNRSFVLEADAPVGGALLVHGLSDSPCSLRTIGERLHSEGWTVIWLRVPGHGTCPAALAECSWEDWAAAVRLGVAGLRSRLPADAPLVLIGFSNGGALCASYAAAQVEDASLPRVDALILFSPMIGIPPAARVTPLHSVVGRLSGLEKTAWSRIETEIDPFKYSSWPMNASVQAWRVTQQLEKRLARIQKAGRMRDYPRFYRCSPPLMPRSWCPR